MNDDLYGLQASGIDPAIAAKMIPLQRQQQIAEALLKQSMQPIDVPRGTKMHPLQGVAQMVQAYMARRGLEKADTERGQLSAQNAEMAKTAMGDYETKRAGMPGIVPATPNDDEGNPMPARAEVKGDPRAAIAQAMSNPLLAKNPLIAADLASMRSEDKPFVVGRSLVDKTGKVLAQDETWAAEQEAARISREESAKANREAKAEADKQRAAEREGFIRLAASLRSPTAPTMSEVVDPKDPKRMLRVDAKLYKGGSLGDEGVLGVSGKEPTVARKEEQIFEGKEGVSSVIGNLRSHYQALQKGGGITDPSGGFLSNIAAGIGSSGPGQAAGRILGTQNQSERNKIAMSRPLLMTAIMKATGMTSKQIDSNAELKLWLATATDPTLDIEANMAALDNLESRYGIGGQQPSASPGKPSYERTATNPQTGEKLGLVNGKWVPIK